MNTRFSSARTRIAVAVLTLPLALCACSEPSPAQSQASSSVVALAGDAPITDLDNQLGELEHSHGVRLGVVAIDPETGRTYGYRADEAFALCSTFKTYAAAAVLQRSAAGASDLNSPVFVDPADVVENSPVTEASAGGSMTLAELAEAALTKSDNTAGNYLLREIDGPSALTSFARTIGDEVTRLDRWEPDLNAAIPGDPRDTSTPRALAGGYQHLLLDNGLQDSERDRLETWMRASTTSETRIRAGLPEGWTSADKSGAGSYGTVNDVGVVWDPQGKPLVLAILSDSTTGLQDAKGNNDAIAAATRAAVGAFTR